MQIAEIGRCIHGSSSDWEAKESTRADSFTAAPYSHHATGPNKDLPRKNLMFRVFFALWTQDFPQCHVAPLLYHAMVSFHKFAQSLTENTRPFSDLAGPGGRPTNFGREAAIEMFFG